MSCPTNLVLSKYLVKEKITDENGFALVNSEVMFKVMDTLNNYAKNTFGVSENVLIRDTATKEGLNHPVIKVDPRVAQEIDDIKGSSDTEFNSRDEFNSQDEFNSPPVGDNYVELLNYKQQQVKKLEDKIDHLKRSSTNLRERKKNGELIRFYSSAKADLEKEIGEMKNSSGDLQFHAVVSSVDRILNDLDHFNEFTLDEIKARRDFIWEFVKGTTFDSQRPSDRFEGLPQTEEYATLRAKLDELKDKYNKQSKKFIEQSLQENTHLQKLIEGVEKSGKDAAEIKEILDGLFFATKDVSVFDKYFLGMNNSFQWETIYPQLMYNELARAQHKEEGIVNRLIQNLKKAVGDEKNIEFVKDRDSKGNLTGYITDAYSATWSDFMYNLNRIAIEFRQSKFGQPVKAQNYRKFINTLRSNADVVDPRKLLSIISAYSNTPEVAKYFKFSEEEAQQYEKELINKIGQDKFDRIVEDITFQVESYLDSLQSDSKNAAAKSASKNIFEFSKIMEDPHNREKKIYFENKDGAILSTFFNDLNNLALIPKEQVSEDDIATGKPKMVSTGFYNENFKKLNAKQREILAKYREAATYFNHTYSLNKYERLTFPKVMQEFNETVAKNFKDRKLGKIAKDLALEYKKFFYETGRFSVPGTDIKSNYRDNSKHEIAERTQIYKLKGMSGEEAYSKAKQEVLSMYSEDTLRDMEALLKLSAQQRARVNAQPKIDSYFEIFKNIKSGKENKERERSIKKVRGWIDRRIYGMSEADRGSKSLTDKSWLNGRNTKKIFQILGQTPVLGKLVDEKTPRLLNEVEKDLYKELIGLRETGFKGEADTSFTVGDVKYTFKIVNLKGRDAKGNTIDKGQKLKYEAKDIGGTSSITKAEFDKKFQEYVENKIDNLGLDLTTSGLIQGIVKTTILKGLGFNWLSGIFNRFEGKNSLLIMDQTGNYWTKGNADMANAHMALYNTVRIAPNFITKAWKSKYEQVHKIHAYLELMDVIQDRKNVFDSNSESSRYDIKGLRMYEWSVENPEAKNQGTIALAVAMDHMITDNQGNKVPMYDSEGNFNAFEFVDGQLQLRPEFVDPANGINDIHDFMATEDMFELKQKMTQAISKSQGNYDNMDVTDITRLTWGRVLSTFTKWRYEHLAQRFSPGEGHDLVFGKQRARGRYMHLFDSPGALTAAAGVGAFVTFGTAIPVIAAAGGAGLANFVIKKYFQNTYAGQIQRESSFLQENIGFLLSTLVETLNYPLRLVNVNGKYRIKYDAFKKLKQNGIMTEEQAGNLAACSRELAISLAWLGILLLFKSLTWDDDDDKDSDRRMLHNFGDNQINRIINSLLAYSNPKAMMSDYTRFAVVEQLFKLQNVLAGIMGDAKSEKSLGKNLLEVSPLPRILYRDRLPWHDKVEYDQMQGIQSTTYSTWTDNFIKSFGSKERYKEYRKERKEEITRELEAEGLEGSELEEAVRKRTRKELLSRSKEMSYENIGEELDMLEEGSTLEEIKGLRGVDEPTREERKEELKAEGLSGKEIAAIMREEFRGR